MMVQTSCERQRRSVASGMRKSQRRPMTMKPSSWISLVMLVSCLLMTITSAQQDPYADYVREVLEESQDANNDDPFEDPKPVRADPPQQGGKAKTPEEMKAQEQADRLAAAREKKFQSDLKKMNDEQKKKALQQKKKDAKVVRRILKAQANEDLYAVLGIRNWDIQIPSRKIAFNITIPALKLKQTSERDIKRAFRKQSRVTHPDKNRDGRAQEAFIAVDEAAMVLTDSAARKEYDAHFRKLQAKRREKTMAAFNKVLAVVRSALNNVMWVFRKVIAPFATPIVILCALII
uniref:J domain-containing protein n=1 Tax=Craspedostauros australis TaxID=1486917 RepID=A0A7R9WQ02_9STRA